MTLLGTLHRRTFLKTLGAGLMIAVSRPLFGQTETRPRRQRGGAAPINIAARVHIGKDGAITILTGKVEGGQGARAEITQAAAEELMVSPDHIQLVMGDTALCPDDGGTFGSQTTPRTIPAVRQGAAAAREILIARACAKWDVETTEVEVRSGTITHPATRRTLTYAELVGDDSAKVLSAPPPKGVTITPVKEWQVLGTSFMRPNARDLVTGTHEYPSNVVRPGMLYGAVLRPPSYGAKLQQIDTGAADTMKDVLVMRDGDFVGVAAGTSFAANAALDAIAKTAVWNSRPAIAVAELYDHLRKTARGIPDTNPFAAELAGATHALHAEYHVAYAQHAPLEPRAAVAEWNDDRLSVWTGSQNPSGVRDDLRKALGLPAESIRVIVPDFGGGFGGKHTGEAAVEAARLAKKLGKPVHIRWTRDEEFTWAYFRPAAVILAEAGLDAGAAISSWYFVNINSGPAGLNTPYVVGKNYDKFVGADAPLRQGSYRALAATANHFARESFMDELAAAAATDPLAFRLAHLKDPRLIAVLQTAADKFDWTNRWKKHDRTIGVGLACGTEKGSYVATCAQVAIDAKINTITVPRVCQAFECGKILNPANLMSQVQGAIIMGMGPALREEIRFDKGTVTNGTFADYEVPRFADLPEITVELLDRPDLPSAGAGETPVITIAPAIANAVFHATGLRVRQMPIRLPSA